jgi:hypothetical protein
MADSEIHDNQTMGIQKGNLIQTNTHHFNTNIRNQNNNSLARKLSPFNLSERRGSNQNPSPTNQRYHSRG